MISNILNHIASGNISDAIVQCLSLKVKKSHENEFLIQSSRFNRVEQEYRVGTIDFAKRNEEVNKITSSIIHILQEIASETPDSMFNINKEKKGINITNLEGSEYFKKFNNRVNKLKYFKNKLAVKDGPTILLPVLFCEEKYQFNEQEIKRADEIEQELKNRKPNPRPNDLCATIINTVFWEDDPMHTGLGYCPLYYSEIKALSENGKKIGIYSVNAVVFCEEEKSLLLHRRSDMSDDFKYKLHTFGGAFMPPGSRRPGDVGGVIDCVKRKILEETGLGFELSRETPTITIDESYINYIQTTFLGVNISKKELLNLRPSEEGTTILVKFDDLEKRLKDIKSWTPTGLIDVIYWLALNAPNTKGDIKFLGKSGNELAEELLDFIDDWEE